MHKVSGKEMVVKKLLNMDAQALEPFLKEVSRKRASISPCKFNRIKIGENVKPYHKRTFYCYENLV